MRIGPRLCLASLLLWLPAATSRAATPDPLAAAAAWIDSLLDGTGAAIGGVGLLAASALGGLGDGVEALDRNRWARPWLHGVASGAIQHVAFGVSYAGSALLEGFRREDIERLPEPRSAYGVAAYGAGRGWTALDGLAALWVGVGDWTVGPARALLHLAGAREAAARLERSRCEAALRWLGPEPLPPRGTGSAMSPGDRSRLAPDPHKEIRDVAPR